MKVYGQGYWDVLALPLKTFWSLNRQVNRLRAEEEMRALKVQVASQSGEAYKTLHEELTREIAKVVVVERSLDEDKFLELQAKFSSKPQG